MAIGAAGIGSLISSLVGLGTTVAGAVPGLKKPKRTNVGSQAAASASARVANAAVGGGQAGTGASRALGARAGLREAGRTVQKAAGAHAQAASVDDARFQTQLTARNKRVADLTAGLGEGLAQAGAGLITPKGEEDAAPVDSELQFPEGTPEAPGGGFDFSPAEGGVSDTPIEQDDTYGLDEMEQDFEQERVTELKAGPTADVEFNDAVDKIIAGETQQSSFEVDQDLEDRLVIQKLMYDEAERQGWKISDVSAKTKRMLQLKSGQTLGNPMGMMDGFDQGDE